MKPEEMTPADLASALRTASKHATKYCTHLMEGGSRVIESQAARIAELEGVQEEELWQAWNAGSARAISSHRDFKQVHPDFKEWLAARKATHKIKSKGSQRLDVNIWPDKDTGGFHQ